MCFVFLPPCVFLLYALITTQPSVISPGALDLCAAIIGDRVPQILLLIAREGIWLPKVSWSVVVAVARAIDVISSREEQPTTRQTAAAASRRRGPR